MIIKVPLAVNPAKKRKHRARLYANEPAYYTDTSGCDLAAAYLGYRPSCLDCPFDECIDKRR